jgi:hypothetical protein
MFLRLLPVVGASVASLWLAAFVAMPGKPLPHNEVQELVYGRLLGRQHRVIALATIVTAIGFFTLVLSMASNSPARSDGAPSQRQICFDGVVLPICYTPQPGGTWAEEELEDGTWHMVGVSYAAPRPPGEKGGAFDP